jgi:hypothetical protein
MLIVVLSVGVAVAAFTAFVVLCLGIRREDRAAFSRSAPTFAARQARRFTGLRTTHPASPGNVTREQSYASERAGVDA